MNRGKKIRQMRRFINNYGTINHEYKRPPNKSYPPYRKGSYEVVFISDIIDVMASVGNVDKYHTYKAVVNMICEYLNATDTNTDTPRYYTRKSIRQTMKTSITVRY